MAPLSVNFSNLENKIAKITNFKLKNGQIKMPVATARQFPEIRLAFKNVPIEQVNADILVANDLAVEYTIKYLGDALDVAMNSSIWAWKEGGNRDIVDTGALRDSLQISKEGNTLTIEYDMPYAALIHYGGYIIPYGDPKNKPVYIPARPWLDSVVFGGGPIDQFDFDAMYDKAFKEVLR